MQGYNLTLDSETWEDSKNVPGLLQTSCSKQSPASMNDASSPPYILGSTDFLTSPLSYTASQLL